VSSIRLTEQDATPDDATSGQIMLYAKTDGQLYTKRGANQETLVNAGSGWSVNDDQDVYTHQQVGIGTVTPTVRLDVKGDTDVSGTLTVGDDLIVGNTLGIDLAFVAQDAGALTVYGGISALEGLSAKQVQWPDGTVQTTAATGSVSKYSTGWVQTVGGTTVADAATLTVPHALGTADISVDVYANDTGSDSGSQMVINQEWPGTGGFFYGAYVVSPSTTNVVVQLAAQGYTKGTTGGNSPATTSWTGDYIKIVVMG